VPDFTSGVVATDCNGSVPLSITQTPTAGTLVGLGVTTVTLARQGAGRRMNRLHRHVHRDGQHSADDHHLRP